MTRFRNIRIFAFLALAVSAASCKVDEIEPAAPVVEQGDAVNLVCALKQPRISL